MPSRRAFTLLALNTILVIGGVLVPALGWTVLAVDAGLLIAVAIDALRARRASISASREWPPLLVQGSPARLLLRIESRGERALVLRLRETLHAGLADAPHRTELHLRVTGSPLTPGASGEWEVGITPRRRGEHTAGPLVARVLGPWGLAWSQRVLLAEEPRRVYPQVRWDGKVGSLLLLAHRRSLGHNPQRMRGLGAEPYALREYLPGDPTGKIHWKASARHGRLVSREDTWELGARLIVLLDCARGMSAMDGQRSKLDHALAASLALTRVAASRGDRVTVAAFSDRVERTVRLHGSARDAHAAYAALYDLEARLAEPAYDVVAAAATAFESRRSTVILFTSVVDLAAAELLRTSLLLLERRHWPILINLEDPELKALALVEPNSTEEAFAKVSALEILLANRRLGRRLRQAGVRCASAAADQLALKALEAYLEMFQRRAA